MDNIEKHWYQVGNCIAFKLDGHQMFEDNQYNMNYNTHLLTVN